VLVIMLVVLTAMSVACTAFVVNDVRLIKQDMVQQLTALAEVLGTTSTAALQKGDRASVEQQLESLDTYSALQSAIICDASGAVFAGYSASDAAVKAPPIASEPGYEFRQGRLEVVKLIEAGGRRIGTVYLEGNLNFIWLQMLQYAVIVVVVLLVSCGSGYLVAAKLQKVISAPILDLTHTAQSISRKNDYGLRVTKSGGDELGTLCDEFNHMLDQIEAAKKELQQSHDELEVRVQVRTRELSEALLRRCLHLWVDFPGPEKEAEIIGLKVPELDERLRGQVARFIGGLRKLELAKAPSIAETLDWARGLCALGIRELDAAAVRQTLSLVCKHEDDLRKAEGKVSALLAVAARAESHHTSRT